MELNAILAAQLLTLFDDANISVPALCFAKNGASLVRVGIEGSKAWASPPLHRPSAAPRDCCGAPSCCAASWFLTDHPRNRCRFTGVGYWLRQLAPLWLHSLLFWVRACGSRI